MQDLILATKTMSSLEIVAMINELRKRNGDNTVLRHDNFMAKVIEVLGESAALKFKGTYKDAQNKERPCYNFPKRESMLMSMSYSYEAQAYVYDKWQEWENKPVPQFKLPQTYKEALLELATFVDKNERLTLENSTLKPKAEFYDCVTGSKDCIAMDEVAKVINLGVGRNKLFAFLRLKGVLRQNNSPYQAGIDAGYFRRVESTFSKSDGSIHINIKTVVFQKGVDYIRRLIQNNQEVLQEIEEI